MDLSSVLNTNSAPEPNKPPQSSSPAAQRQSHPPPLAPPPGANGPSASFSQHPSHQSTPQYAPPPHEHRSPTGSIGFQSKGATPLHAPSNAAPGQYPFPQHASQSPVATHPSQQYPQYGRHSSATPGSRPMSHGYQQQPPTPSQMPSGGVPPGFQQYSSSHSPTPPSHHTQTPHSVRQSPLNTFAHPPQPPSAQQHNYQHSQPSTPLGPPSLQYQRSHAEVFSPNHHRNFSGASNGMVSGSPAQHQPSVGNLIDSPSAYSRQSPQVRRTSDYLSQGERERSLSVSPKTKVIPRLPSHGSRQSSVNEGYSARTSSHPQPYEVQSHVQSPVAGRQMGVAQSSFVHSASDVTQMGSRSSQVSYSDAPSQPAPQTPLFSNAAHPQHQNQKMGMDNLLTPSQEVPSSERSSTTARNHSIDARASAITQSPRYMDAKQDPASHALLQQPVQPAMRSVSNGEFDQKSTDSRKRPADHEPASEPPTKRGKKRKYGERPIWATLARSNPRFDGANGLTGQSGKPAPRQQQQQSHHQQQARSTPQLARAPHPHQRSNGHPQTNGAPVPAEPWLQDPPLDTDLIRARSVLGPWEKTFKYNTPIPSMLKVVQDWFWSLLEQHADIGTDPRTGTIEIEAKIGTLVRSGERDRAQGPLMSVGVLHPSLNNQYRFESRMEEPEHEAMNKFLNATAQASMAPGRVHMQYEHLYQTDTFATLSPAGLAALPPIVQRKPLHGRELRLRTTRNTKTKQVIAHIIKVNLADLHIQNPGEPYDCRISMNLEVNLDRPDLRIEDLIEPPAHDKPPPPERRKDRLSYKHLAYSVDLTKVESAGVPPKYELELEVDANVLRAQIARVKKGQESAYGDVVSGFLDNATFLMRQAP